MDCLFCKIGRGEIASQVIYEDDNVLAFLDIHPLAEGHTLVIPKKHAENILDIDEANLDMLFRATKHVTALLKESLSSEGFTIGINQGRIGGQLVSHLHVHIIPRFEGDGGGSLHSVVNNRPAISVQETKLKIVGSKNKNN